MEAVDRVGMAVLQGLEHRDWDAAETVKSVQAFCATLEVEEAGVEGVLRESGGSLVARCLRPLSVTCQQEVARRRCC